MLHRQNFRTALHRRYVFVRATEPFINGFVIYCISTNNSTRISAPIAKATDQRVLEWVASLDSIRRLVRCGEWDSATRWRRWFLAVKSTQRVRINSMVNTEKLIGPSSCWPACVHSYTTATPTAAAEQKHWQARDKSNYISALLDINLPAT